MPIREWKAAFLTMLCLLLCEAVFATAQTRPQPKENKNPRLNYEKVQQAVKDIEKQSDRFKSSFRRALNISVLDNSSREDELNRQARRLESAMDRVKKCVNKKDSFQDIRRDVETALNAGRDINVTMRRRRLSSEAESDWAGLRIGLNYLAGLFGLSKIG